MLILPFLILSYDILHLLHCLLISYSIFCCIVSSHTAIVSYTRTLPTFEFWPLQNNSTPHYLFRWCHYFFSYRRKGPRRSRRVRHLSVRTYLINANTDLRLLSLMCYFLFLFPPSLRLSFLSSYLFILFSFLFHSPPFLLLFLTSSSVSLFPFFSSFLFQVWWPTSRIFLKRIPVQVLEQDIRCCLIKFDVNLDVFCHVIWMW